MVRLSDLGQMTRRHEAGPPPHPWDSTFTKRSSVFIFL